MSKIPKTSGLKKDDSQYRQHLRDERAHMEGLLNQRFNFFIIILGAIIASFPSVQNQTQLTIVLIAGLFFEFVFMLLIGRAQRRLNINLNLLSKLPNDPIAEIGSIAQDTSIFNLYRYSVGRLIGYYIPLIINVALFISIVYVDSLFSIIKEGR